MLGYMIAKNGDKRVVVTLEIPADALTNMERTSVAVKETAMYRTNKAIVLKIEDVEENCYTTATSLDEELYKLDYKVGELLEEPSYDCDPEKVYAEGIYFFLSRQLNVLKNIAKGLCESWYENGQKSEELSKIDGNLHGLYQSWYENGQKSEEVMYVYGKKHGLYQSWHKNGQKWDERSYVDGKRHGLYQLWHENGQILLEVTFVDDKRHGLYRHWYRNGQKKEECSFVNGGIHGLYQRWDKDGAKIEEVTYVDGVRQ